MSAEKHTVGTALMGNGKEKIDPRIEAALETFRPCHLLDRRSAVYTLLKTNFSRCGLTQPGYIYRVTSSVAPQLHDLGWIGPMQMALLKQKYPDRLGMKKYPNWDEEFIKIHCKSYWASIQTDDPTWEALFKECLVVERLSNKPIEPSKTKSGFNLFP